MNEMTRRSRMWILSEVEMSWRLNNGFRDAVIVSSCWDSFLISNMMVSKVIWGFEMRGENGMKGGKRGGCHRSFAVFMSVHPINRLSSGGKFAFS